MKIAIIVARVLLGLVFVVFGSNGFLHFLPMPPMEGPAGAFMGAMFSSGYLSAVFALQLVGGLLLLSGKFVPLGLTLLGPVIVNIVLFHCCLAPAGLPLAGVTAALALFVLYGYRASFAPLVKP